MYKLELSMTAISIQCIPKLSPQEAKATTAILNFDVHGNPIAYEMNPQKQTNIPFDNVTPIGGGQQ